MLGFRWQGISFDLEYLFYGTTFGGRCQEGGEGFQRMQNTLRRKIMTVWPGDFEPQIPLILRLLTLSRVEC